MVGAVGAVVVVAVVSGGGGSGGGGQRWRGHSLVLFCTQRSRASLYCSLLFV